MNRCSFQIVFFKDHVCCQSLNGGSVEYNDLIRLDDKNLLLRMHLYARRINSCPSGAITQLILPCEVISIDPLHTPEIQSKYKSSAVMNMFKNLEGEDSYFKVVYTSKTRTVIAVKRLAVNHAVGFVRAYGIEPSSVSSILKTPQEAEEKVINIIDVKHLEDNSDKFQSDCRRESSALPDCSSIPSALQRELLKRQLYAQKKQKKQKKYHNRRGSNVDFHLTSSKGNTPTIFRLTEKFSNIFSINLVRFFNSDYGRKKVFPSPSLIGYKRALMQIFVVNKNVTKKLVGVNKGLVGIHDKLNHSKNKILAIIRSIITYISTSVKPVYAAKELIFIVLPRAMSQAFLGSARGCIFPTTSLGIASSCGVAVVAITSLYVVFADDVTNVTVPQATIHSDLLEVSRPAVLNASDYMLEFFVTSAPEHIVDSSMIYYAKEVIDSPPVISAKLRPADRISNKNLLIYDVNPPDPWVSPEFALEGELQNKKYLKVVHAEGAGRANSYEIFDPLAVGEVSISATLTTLHDNEHKGLESFLDSEFSAELSSASSAPIKNISSDSFTTLQDTVAASEPVDVETSSTLEINLNQPNRYADLGSGALSTVPVVRPRKRPSTLSTRVELSVETSINDSPQAPLMPAIAPNYSEALPPIGFRVLAIVGAGPGRKALVEFSGGQTEIVSVGSSTPLGRVVHLEQDSLILQTDSSQITIKVGG